MREIALHILDIAENGVTAEADCIHIQVEENRSANLLKIVVADNGKGIAPDKVHRITDPFFTTRTTRRVGLGLSLFETAARRCQGDFAIESEPGKGTRITATFQYNHIDRVPVGDMAATIATLIIGNPKVDFGYHHSIDGRLFSLDTREIKQAADGVSLSDPVVVHRLTRQVRNALQELESKES